MSSSDYNKQVVFRKLFIYVFVIINTDKSCFYCFIVKNWKKVANHQANMQDGYHYQGNANYRPKYTVKTSSIRCLYMALYIYDTLFDIVLRALFY